ncbi:helix-turn-helix transcriptional regulator [Mechercharimyces sp. CAU 1602]|uniref:ArsR/SmtB family transcription factor n=1 Tax=Mechercharimyces sp. CAU 1602 TaxID=2973933 RepID=UPI0021621C72|nr:metalloregulator ArsR/SmtB family transcription factor [Mechercharimyces sp. CAU 1602]MCS1350989.1 metalloregulator ArsR/SmtB family transcription factor [Mechercharimyces sp. CAU 1602]
MEQMKMESFCNCTPIFHALGDPARQRIILMLVDKERLSVNEIAEQSTLSRPAISHHLKVLREAGLVHIEQKGTQRFYSLSMEDAIGKLKALVQAVEHACEK